MGRATNRQGAAEARSRRLRHAELACWILAAALMLPQIAAVAARGAMAAPLSDEDWSPSRREAYTRLLDHGGLPAPIGELRLTEQDRAVPVFSGTGESSLTLGAGHLPETSALGDDGNIAIAGHRDGFFRALRHLEPGHRLILSTDRGPRTFEVSDVRVVSPNDVWVLDPTPETILTLITCHPFYFVGSAPNRYIVRARLASEEPAGSSGSTHVSMTQ